MNPPDRTSRGVTKRTQSNQRKTEDPTSVFLAIERKHWVLEGEHFFVIKDKYPVSEGHLLIISKVMRKDYFSLSETERAELPKMVDLAAARIEAWAEARESQRPDGFNIGMNCGEAAGQTVFHFHCHVIPRYHGDMEDPRGGVRHVVAGKGYYSQEQEKESQEKESYSADINP